MFSWTKSLRRRTIRRPRPHQLSRTRLWVRPLEERAVPAVVTNTDDTGPGSLRDAITNAAFGETITFDTTGAFAGGAAIVLTSGQLNIFQDLTIQGTGSGSLTILSTAAAGATSRHFSIDGAGVINVNISGMTLSGGNASSAGGSISVTDENVTLTDMTLRFNSCTVTGGGAIAITGAASVTLTNSTLSANTATTAGGAILAAATSNLNIQNCAISGNSSTGSGGGVTFQGNSLVVDRTSFIANTAGPGGAVFLGGTPVTTLFTNTTISGNRAADGGAFRPNNFNSKLEVLNCTITNNTATTNTGGINWSGGTGSMNTENTLWAGNADIQGDVNSNRPDLENNGIAFTFTNCAIGSTVGLGGNITYLGTNIIGVAMSTLLLGPLKLNGGRSQTHSPLPGSPLIDAGAVSSVGLVTDQRGQPRVFGGNTDIGAVEINVNAPQAAATFSNVTTPGGTSYTFNVTYTDDTQVALASLGNGNVRVIGPGTNVLATFVPPGNPNANASPLVATYKFTPPGGTWDASDNGTFSLSVEPTQVSDIGGTPAYVAAGLLGQFTVGLGVVIPVTSTADSGTGSLRDAIDLANLTPATRDTITFDPGTFGSAQTIQLNGQISISGHLQINGTGAGLLTLQNIAAVSATSRIFNINGVGALDVALNGMTYTSGNVNTVGGGAIVIADETVVISNSIFKGNTASAIGGGAVAMTGSGNLTVLNTSFQANRVTIVAAGITGGAAVFTGIGSTLTIRNSPIMGNSSSSHGGGLVTQGAVTVESSAISGNTAVRGGGGTYHTGTAVGVNFSNSIIANNFGADGGGIRANGLNAPIQLFNSTVIGNSATVNGGGINRAGGNSTIYLENTVLANNLVNGNSPDVENGGTLLTAKNSAIGTQNGITPGLFTDLGGNIPFGTDLRLGQLVDNGGGQLSILPAFGSPLRNAGTSSTLTLDLRGQPRLQGSAVDIGATESTGADPIANAILPNVKAGGGATAEFTVTYYDDTGINVSKFGGSNITVTYPNGTTVVPAAFKSAAPGTGAATEVVTYEFAAPGGTWDQADNGTYSVNLLPNQISDNAANFIPGAVLGQFSSQVGKMFTVTNTGDASTTAGTLRNVLVSANDTSTIGGGVSIDTIVFDPSVFNSAQTISVNGQMTISDHLTIIGPGSGLLTLNNIAAAGTGSRFFDITTNNTKITVNISGMKLSGGNLTTANGGAIQINNEIVNLNDIVFSGNKTVNTGTGNGGGAIAVSNPSVVNITNSTFTGNTTGGATTPSVGGAIRTGNNTVLTIDASTFSGNTSGGAGGAIYATGSSVSILNSTLSANTVTGSNTGTGGAIALANQIRVGSSSVIRNSTISGNSASVNGGAVGLVANFIGTLVIQNSTITNNSANGVTANQGGGGIHFNDQAAPFDGKLSIESTILSGNKQVGSPATVAPDVFTLGAVDYKTSALGSSTGIATLNNLGGNLAIGAVLQLGALANNGGTMLTHLPGGTSPVRNAGSNPAALAFDQRGVSFPRVLDGAIDIGSIESIAGIPFASGTFGNIVVDAPGPQTIQIKYEDNSGIKVSTLDSKDIRVIGPNGFNVLATFKSVDINTNGTPRIATYEFSPPGGSWDGADDGTYKINIEPNEVGDDGVDFVLAGEVGSFQVLIPRNFVVTTTTDSGAGSLRQAIIDANAITTTPVDSITFDPVVFATAQVINLSSGEMSISDSIVITGPSTSTLTINANKLSRIFNINGSGTLNVAISNITLTNGSIAAQGGAIVMDNESVTLNAVNISASTSTVTGGGAIGMNATGGILTISNSTLTGNSGTTAGGAIAVLGAATLSLKNSVLTANSSTGGNGGAIGTTVAGSSVTISFCDISNNSAANGAGVYITGCNYLVENSGFGFNIGTGQGGAVYVTGGSAANAVVFNNTTLYSNTAADGGAFRPQGSNIDLIINNCTVVNNFSTVNAGAINVAGGSGKIFLESTIIFGNNALGAAGHPEVENGNVANAFTIGHSLIGNPAGLTGQVDLGTNLPAGTDPLLQPYGNYGGPTKSLLPMVGSPVLEAGGNPLGFTLDQRGFTRVIGVIDIGAVELDTNSPTAVVEPLTNIFTAGGTLYTIKVTYADDTAIKVSTLDGNDVRITGPGAFNVLAKFVSVDINTDGTPRTATYSFVPPGSSWDRPDNGSYTVTMEPNQVTDTGSTPVHAGSLGTFIVDIPLSLVVNAANDEATDTDGKLSLREAILQSIAQSTSAEISFDATVFASAQTITLGLGEFAPTKALTITGPTVGVTINAAGKSRVFNLAGVPTVSTVTLQRLTLTNANGAGNGGAILAGTTNLSLDHVTISLSSASGAGGAIGLSGGSTGMISITDSTLSGNTAAKGGGVYFFTTGNLLMLRSTVSGNVATSATGGGGIYNFSNSAVITNSTISGNSSAGNGGGILLQSTANVTLNNSTVANNTAANNGGGINALAGTLVLYSTVIANNAGAIPDLIAPGAVQADYSLVGNTFVALNGTNVQANLDALLGPLANNGGPTMTHLPLAGSPLIDMGSDSLTLGVDQRGLARSLGAAVDVGATEVDANIPTAVAGPLAPVNTPGGSLYMFTVTFADDVAIKVSTLNSSDVRITGPAGFNVLATFDNVDINTDGTPRVATYKFTPPGGSWSGAAAGVYTVSMEANQVSDTSGTFVAPGTLGTFQVNIAGSFLVDEASDIVDANETKGHVSFREALNRASGTTGTTDTITFDAAVFKAGTTISLLNGQFNISDSVIITGPGSANLILNANKSSRLFNITDNSVNFLEVMISGMTLLNGSTSGPGGAIAVADESVTLTDVNMSGNTAASTGGGALALTGAATVTLVSSVLSANTTSVAPANATGGGAIFTAAGSMLTILNSTLAGNSSASHGGAVVSLGGLMVDGSTISGNTTNLTAAVGQAGGGAFYFTGTPSVLLFTNTTISGNSGQDGGAFRPRNLNTALQIYNSTIVNNTATVNAGGINWSGGLGTLDVQNSIISGNFDVGAAAPFNPDVENNNIPFSLLNSAIGSPNGVTALTDLGGNLPYGADLKLGPLANNGGPTQTHFPLAGSPLLDVGSNPSGLITDQRGFNRTVGAGTDIGAVEVQSQVAKFTNLVINNGDVQRSRVTTVRVNFDAPVAFTGSAANAFSLTRLSDNGVVHLNAVVDAGGKFVTLTFIGGLVDGKAGNFSLQDGRYTLKISAGQFGAEGFDGNGNGTAQGSPADDVVIASASTGTPTNIFRRFGDIDGNGVANGNDFLQFRLRFLQAFDAFDYDGNGTVDGVDFLQFRLRFLAPLP